MDIIEFKKQCILLEPDIIVQKHIIEGSTYYFEQLQLGNEFEFKKEIATILKVHIRDIVIVGSGKLGFSIKPDTTSPAKDLYLFKKFDYNYSLNNVEKRSDLDIAIVSTTLFDKEMENLYSHTNSYELFTGRDRTDFAKYILKGRFIIDYLPTDFKLSKELSLVQSTYKQKFGRDINLEIYKSWFFFETYHKKNILRIKLNLIA